MQESRSSNWLGNAIRERRKALRLNQDDLARLAGVGRVFISEAELGKPSIRLDKLNSLLEALGLELALIDRKQGGIIASQPD